MTNRFEWGEEEGFRYVDITSSKWSEKLSFIRVWEDGEIYVDGPAVSMTEDEFSAFYKMVGSAYIGYVKIKEIWGKKNAL